MNEIMERRKPGVFDWVPAQDQIYFNYDGDIVTADYTRVGLRQDHPLSIYRIEKFHYKKKMADVVQHMNYFVQFYDLDKEFFMSSLSVKTIIDDFPDIPEKAFKGLILDRIVTDTFIEKCKQMAKDLYTVNINSDVGGKYKNTPKITNDQGANA